MRGLKHSCIFDSTSSDYVARFARAWIETLEKMGYCLILGVARFARAWIETVLLLHGEHKGKVARFARAWIETTKF